MNLVSELAPLHFGLSFCLLLYKFDLKGQFQDKCARTNFQPALPKLNSHDAQMAAHQVNTEDKDTTCGEVCESLNQQDEAAYVKGALKFWRDVKLMLRENGRTEDSTCGAMTAATLSEPDSASSFKYILGVNTAAARLGLPVADASLRASAAAPLSAAAFLAMGLVAAVVAFRRRMAGGVAGKHPTEATPLIVKR